MNTWKLLPALIAFTLTAGCQHAQRSATLSRDRTDNEVTLSATSRDTSVSSDGQTAALYPTAAAAPDSSEGKISGQVDSSANTGDVKEPDNTGRNVRDRHHQMLTAMDQGSSDADV